jgi:hypothetical protein
MSIEQWFKNSLFCSSFMAPAPIRAECAGGGSPFYAATHKILHSAIRILHSQTGNPPEGWESEGQIRSLKLGTRPQGGSPKDKFTILNLKSTSPRFSLIMSKTCALTSCEKASPHMG